MKHVPRSDVRPTGAERLTRPEPAPTRSTGRAYSRPERVGSMSDAPAAKRVRRSKAEQRAETLEQILDAAEFLFSRRGLSGVTLRDVAAAVGVHTTLLHYYFDDKKSLFDAV